MADKIKEFRDKNPVLDFFAGFIPGVGEIQDIHDFSHAAKNNDFGGMALASLGFIIPGIVGSQIKRGAELIKSIGGRKFAKATDPPIYNKETAPKTLKLTKRDITEMHLNDGSVNSEQLQGKELVDKLNKKFNQADHGTAMRIGLSLKEPHDGLSGKSAPLFLSMTTRWAKQGKGGFFVPKGEPEKVTLNKVAQLSETVDGKIMKPFDQKFVDGLNQKIEEINSLGYNFPKAELINLKNPWRKDVKEAEWLAWEKAPKLGKVLIPNIGFLKYKYGGKI